jgi:hypothetical protein
MLENYREPAKVVALSSNSLLHSIRLESNYLIDLTAYVFPYHFTLEQKYI